MALIICPECGKEISDKAAVCIHCGYPIQEMKQADTNKTYHVVLMDCGKYKTKMISALRDINHIGLKEAMDLASQCPVVIKTTTDENQAKKLVDQILKEGGIAQISNKNQINTVSTSTPSSSNPPKCPTCGSTNIQKISATKKAAGAIGFGLFSKTAKSQFECKNCGYKW